MLGRWVIGSDMGYLMCTVNKYDWMKMLLCLISTTVSFSLCLQHIHNTHLHDSGFYQARDFWIEIKMKHQLLTNLLTIKRKKRKRNEKFIIKYNITTKKYIYVSKMFG